jgi:hypothetical protein
MSFLVALLLVSAGGTTSHVPAAALPEAVTLHPAAEGDPSPPAVSRWSAEALAAWPGPWDVRPPGLYDHRYITW